MTTLLTVLGHPDPTRRARRDLAYGSIVAFVDDPASPALEDLREMEALAGGRVEAVEVDPREPLEALATMEATVDDLAAEDVVFQVNALDNRLTHPAILCCFRQGVTAWFCTEKGSHQLPVLEGVEIGSMFSPAERRTLLTLPDETGREAAVEAADDPRERVLEALLGLEAKGLVEADGQRLRVTEAGRYYRGGLQGEGAGHHG